MLPRELSMTFFCVTSRGVASSMIMDTCAPKKIIARCAAPRVDSFSTLWRMSREFFSWPRRVVLSAFFRLTRGLSPRLGRGSANSL